MPWLCVGLADLCYLGPLLLTWINLFPAWINNYTHYIWIDSVEWNYLAIPKLQS